MMFIRNPYIFAILYYVRFKMPVSVFKGLSALMPANKTLKQNAMLLEKLETRHSRITDTFTVLYIKKKQEGRSEQKQEKEGGRRKQEGSKRKKKEEGRTEEGASRSKERSKRKKQESRARRS